MLMHHGHETELMHRPATALAYLRTAMSQASPSVSTQSNCALAVRLCQMTPQSRSYAHHGHETEH